MKRIALVITIILWASAAFATNYYVDPQVASSGNGQSWATAWKALGNITGVIGGDTVYISGGTTSQTYSSGYVFPSGSSPTSRVTYKIGQEAGHNGMAIFTAPLGTGNYTVIDGNYNGQRHFSFLVEFQLGASQYTKLTYVDTGVINGSQHPSYYEISYCSNANIGNTADHWATFTTNDLGVYGANSIHDNYITIAHKNDHSGYGTDGIQWAKNADIYNNTFIGFSVAATISQHQDAIQTDCNYCQVYNNTFINMANYAVYWDMYGSRHDVKIYNNVMYMRNTEFSGGYQQAIAIGPEAGVGTLYPQRFLVANNTVANYATNYGVVNVLNSGQVWDSSTIAYNNVVCGGGNIQISPGVTGYGSPTNKSISSGCANIFAAYQTPTSSNYAYDFHLKSTDTVLKDQGTNAVSSYFTTDKDRNPRPQGNAWDIGAYEGPGVQAIRPMPPSLLSIN